MNKQLAIVGFLAMIGIVLLAGSYAADYGQAEMVHFWTAVPGGNITTTTTLRGVGMPVTMSPIFIDLDERGALRDYITPQVEAISTHWIYNLGKTPVRIKMELINLTVPVRWEVQGNMAYDPENHTFAELIMPGGSVQNLGIDWYFYIPAYYMDEQIVYMGGLLLSNADTGQGLTFIPITIGRGTPVYSSGGGCCS
jgi:hypothetical protein